jgi:phosphoserine aminotransferase
MPWDKLDVVARFWQEVMGGEAAHGMISLSPRAVMRLESYTPAWPMPKIFQMTKGGKLVEGIFQGETINTPSMLCVEDALDGLKWGQQIGGLNALLTRSAANLKALEEWVAVAGWIGFLAEQPETRSNASVCFKITDPWYTSLSPEEQEKGAKKIVSLLEAEGVAYDIGAYRDAPAELRIWAGATVETSNLKALFPWLDWAWNEVKSAENKAL